MVERRTKAWGLGTLVVGADLNHTNVDTDENNAPFLRIESKESPFLDLRVEFYFLYIVGSCALFWTSQIHSSNILFCTAPDLLTIFYKHASVGVPQKGLFSTLRSDILVYED